MEKVGVADQKMVVFAVGHQEYAVPITVVKEVQAWTMPTPVPEAPPIVEGVIDLRGEIIPVVDLGRRFRTTRRNQGADARIMVMEFEGRHAGWIVDEVVEVHTPAPGAIAPPSPILMNMASVTNDPVVSGILKIGSNRLVVVLDAMRVLEAALQ
ncbi:MAG: chemotaxis protein CheW [Bacillota bacterium]